MATSSTALSPEQTQSYWDNGFVFPVTVMDGAEAQEWRTAYETFEDTWRSVDLPLPLNTYKRVNAQCVIPMAAQLGADPRILDAVESLLGPDILIYGVEFFVKEAKTRQMVSMHQDLTYWGLGATSEMVTAWLALSPSTRASGCMDFVKGSHKQPIQPHADTFDADNLLSRGQEIRVEIAEDDKTPITLAPGQMSLHHGLTIHGSGPNRADDRRIGVAIRYVTPNVLQNVAEADYAMLVRGADRVGNFINVAPPHVPFDARSLALYEEIRKTQAQATMAGTKNSKGLYA